MAVLGTYVGNVGLPVSLNLAGTTLTDLVVATDDTLTVASISFANDTAGAVSCYVYWYQASSLTNFMIWVGSVPTKTTATITDIPIRLRKSDKIKVIGAVDVRATAITMTNFALAGRA
jgi:hypothetical protein